MTEGGPRTIGQYEIIGLLGRGGMANVYRAIQPSMERREVAIKVLPATFSQDEAFLERFQREIRLVARLQHPRILPVYDSGEQDGVPYIVMALMSGGTLSDLIHDSPQGMPAAEVARLVEQMAEGLDYAHRQGVIHRDFKPSNVLLDSEGNINLTDFGIAKATAETGHLTGTGVIGTPAYMAPELSKEGGLSSLVDIYALGVTVYQMLSGQEPYGAETPLGMMVAHVTQPIPDIRKYRRDLSSDIQTVILRAMAKDPTKRYQTARAMANDLKTIAAGSPLEGTDTARGLHLPPERHPAPSPGVPSAQILGASPYDPSEPHTPAPSGTDAIPMHMPRKRPKKSRSRRGWITWVAAAALICLAVVAITALAGVYSFPSLAWLFPETTPSASPEAQVVVVVTSTPIPTETPDPNAPKVTNIRFCSKPCDRPTAIDMPSYPENVAYVYISMEFSGMVKGMAYSREWSNRGETWVHYDCKWEGDPSMRRDVTLRDINGGLRSGEWTMTISIEGKVAATATTIVNGGNQNWNPFNPLAQNCPDWK